MELKQLRFLAACAQTHSFSKAAELLYTSQSNVSKVIRSLEEELGTELFERRQYGIVLTEQGRVVYEGALELLAGEERITSSLRSKMRKTLRITSNPSSWMASAFRDYFKAYEREDAEYSFITASTNRILQRLAEDTDQIGFIYIMEDQLPLLKSSFARNHIGFRALKRTGAMLYFGNEEAKDAYEHPLEYGKRPALVQGYEDEYTLQASWYRAQMPEDSRQTDAEDENSGDRLQSRPRIAVTTNSDYVMHELLTHTRLGNISGNHLSDNGPKRSAWALPLYEEENVLFGCLFRNDRNLGELEKEFLGFIQKRIQGTEG